MIIMTNKLKSLICSLLILTFGCNSIYSQNSHLVFKGIPLNGDPAVIYSKLVKKGFYQSTNKDYTVEGTFIIPQAEIEILRTYGSNNNYGVEISYTLPTKWGMEATRDTLIDYIQKTYKAVWAGGYGKDGYEVLQYITPDKNKGIFILHHPSSYEGDGRTKFPISLAILDKSNFMKYVVSEIPHLDFLGIPINGFIDSFQKKLANKGIFIDSQNNRYAEKGVRIFKGSFYGYKDCEIKVLYNEKNNIVFRVDVIIKDFPETNDNVIGTIVHQLTTHYKQANLKSIKRWSSDHASCEIMASRENGEISEDILGKVTISGLNFTHHVIVSFWDDFNWTRNY